MVKHRSDSLLRNDSVGWNGNGEEIFFIFTFTWGDDPIWGAYFSDGLKPPTSYFPTKRTGFPFWLRFLSSHLSYCWFQFLYHESFSSKKADQPTLPNVPCAEIAGLAFFGLMNCRFPVNKTILSPYFWRMDMLRGGVVWLAMMTLHQVEFPCGSDSQRQVVMDKATEKPTQEASAEVLQGNRNMFVLLFGNGDYHFRHRKSGCFIFGTSLTWSIFQAAMLVERSVGIVDGMPNGSTSLKATLGKICGSQQSRKNEHSAQFEILLMVQKSGEHHWDVWNPVNNGINYQSQLVSRISEPSTVWILPPNNHLEYLVPGSPTRHHFL